MHDNLKDWFKNDYWAHEEAAYQHCDLLEKRRKMMNTWANYCLNGDT
jgi:hypothetical protein